MVEPCFEPRDSSSRAPVLNACPVLPLGSQTVSKFHEVLGQPGLCLWPKSMLAESSHYCLQAKVVSLPSLFPLSPEELNSHSHSEEGRALGGYAGRAARVLGHALKGPRVSSFVADCGLRY